MVADRATTHPMRRLLSNRRGLLAGAAALLGAGLAKLGTPARAEAADGDPLLIGRSTNSGASVTFLNKTTTADPAFVALVSTVSFFGSPDGVQGGTVVAGGAGVRGWVQGAGTVAGVKGSVETEGPTVANRAGVLGTSNNSDGVTGTSTNLSGVFGVSGALGPALGPAGVMGTSSSRTGVYGTSSGSTGVQGTSTNGYGVRGDSTSGIGVYGASTVNHGCGGSTSHAGSAGLFGLATTAGATGLLGVHSVAGGLAGFFSGNVYVTGTLTVASGAKSAAVKKRDGSMARMYCQESPEPWFEDFGTAQLQNGQASVALSADFDEVVDGTDYRVFLTPIGVDCSLYVSRLAPHRFEVRSVGGGGVNGTFHYRVVARRLDDVGTRLEKVDVPKVALPDLQQLTRPAPAPATSKPQP